MDDTNVTPDAAGIVERLRAYRPTSEWGDPIHHVICDEAAATIAAQAAELQRLREGMTRAEAAFTLIAGSHWERFGIDQTDVEQVPDLSSDEAMNVARDFLAYDDFPATSQVRHD